MGLKEYLPHLLMTLSFCAMAIFAVFISALITGGMNAIVFVVYQHLIGTSFLAALAFLFERGKRPPVTLNIFLWAFLIGFLQICLCQILLTKSLGYISATFQTTALNTSGAITFLMAIAFQREKLVFCTINGQAKLWGIIISLIGATMMVLWPGPKLGGLSSLHDFSNMSDRVIGSLMILCALFAGASVNLLVEHVSIKYPAAMTLSAMIGFSGTVQAAIIAGLTVRRVSAWKISFNGSHEIVVILYGAIVVAGLAFYAQNWSIQKRGPVFTMGFSPLLIVFSFILETFFLGEHAHLGSILGAVLVIGGLYMLLWAKADDNQEMLNANLAFAATYEQLS